MSDTTRRARVRMMRGLASLCLALISLLWAPSAHGGTDAGSTKGGAERPVDLSFDIRVNGRGDLRRVLEQTPPAIRQRAAGVGAARGRTLADGLARLRAQAPAATVQPSPLTGSAEVVRAGGKGLSAPTSGRPGVVVARDFIRMHRDLYGLSADQVDRIEFRGESRSVADRLRMVRLRQRVRGIEVFQSDTRVLIDRDGRVVRTVGRLVPGVDESLLSAGTLLPPEESLRAALTTVGIEAEAGNMLVRAIDGSNTKVEIDAGHASIRGAVPTWRVYFPLGPGLVIPAWSHVVVAEGPADWYFVVDGRTGTLLYRKNIQHAASTQEARFDVYTRAGGVPAESPAPGPTTPLEPGIGTQFPAIARTTESMLARQSATASPEGWIDDGGETTTGNNVDAYLDRDDDNLPDEGILDQSGRPVGNPDASGRNRDFLGAAPRSFAYTPAPLGGNPDAGDSPSTPASQRGAVTHTFYAANHFHDRLHALGFDEAAGNFQADNFGRGGLAGDQVLAEVQNGADLGYANNAFFTVPPDGISGAMELMLFSGPTPDRDPALDTTVVLHELAHGLSNRLVGDAAGLNWAPGAGLGEGWSDFYALALLYGMATDNPGGQYPNNSYLTYRVVSTYADNYVYGGRRFPYTTDNSRNPLTWADADDTIDDMSGGMGPSPLGFHLNGAYEVHNLGEIWALSLWEVRSRIIAAHGGDVALGNEIMLQLVTDALKMTPLDPGFIEARDALIDADCATSACAHEPAIWEGFADRGLGYGAHSSLPFAIHLGVRESFLLPHLDVAGVTIDDSGGNGNGYIDPGETVAISVSLTNPWREAARGVASAAAALSSLTPQVTVVDAGATYGSIPAQGTAAGDSLSFTVDAGVACGQALRFSLAVSSVLGDSTAYFTLRAGRPVGPGTPVVLTRAPSGGLAIPDGLATGVADTFSVAADMEIADLDMRIDSLTHSWVGDLSVMLRAPDGLGVEMLYRLIGCCGLGSNSGADFVNTRFDDSSLNDLLVAGPAAAPFTGDWLPSLNSPSWSSEDPIGQLSQFVGLGSQGDWRLFVADYEDADPGYLASWSLIVTPVKYQCCAATDAMLDADQDGFAACEGDCDDASTSVHPGGSQVCGDGVNNDCNHPAWPALAGTNETDDDGDQFTECAGDCRDSSASVYPGASQVCGDGLNNDCGHPSWPSLTGTIERDDDGDALSECAGDCDDTTATTFPAAVQVCGDGLNNDCNHPSWPALAGTNEIDDDGDALSECAGDCDDGQATVHPGGLQVCGDGLNNDCTHASWPSLSGTNDGDDDRSLDPGADWSFSSGQAGENLGQSVASAGDVNGDGFEEIIVGVPGFDNLGFNEGRALLFMGTATGPELMASWTVEGGQEGAEFGRSVAGAGDVNGDGYDDVLVGAWRYDNGSTDEGAAFLYMGSDGGLSSTPGWTVEGQQFNAAMGVAVAGAGDVNGDGFADVIVGASQYSNGQVRVGSAHIFLGSAAGLSATAAWVLEGGQDGARFGEAVAAAGDMDGDGLDDILVGAPGADFFDWGTLSMFTDAGEAFIYRSTASGPELRYSIVTTQVSAEAGAGVAGAGDVNGDGFADILVAAPLFEDGETNEGLVALFTGNATLTYTPAPWGWVGDQVEARLGSSLAPAGDLNGDGLDDIVVGAAGVSNGESGEGIAAVFLGRPDGLSAEPFGLVEGGVAGAALGQSVAGADTDGDGRMEILAGLPGFAGTAAGEGAARLYRVVGDLLTECQGDCDDSDMRVYPGASQACDGVNNDCNDSSWPVVPANEIDSDLDGALLCAPDCDDSVAAVYPGAPQICGDALNNDCLHPAWPALTATNEVDDDGDTLSECSGDCQDDSAAVFPGAPQVCGDALNNDCAHPSWPALAGSNEADDDLDALSECQGDCDDSRSAVYPGAPQACDGLNNDCGDPAWPAVPAAEANADGDAFRVCQGDCDDARATVYPGAPQACDGLNNDCSLPGWPGLTGTNEMDDDSDLWSECQGDCQDTAAAVYPGAPQLCGDLLNNDCGHPAWPSIAGTNEADDDFALPSAPSWAVESDLANAALGASAASAGDVNGDGFEDVIVGLPGYSNGQASEGAAHLYHGSSSGLATTASWTLESNLAGAELGAAVAGAGDVNNDGFDDVLIGAPKVSNGQTSEGRAYLYLGSPSGLATTPAWSAEGNLAGVEFGSAVAGAGNVNNDAYDDVVIGAPKYSSGQTNEGRAFLYLGTATGLALSAAWTAESNQTSAQFGAAVAGAGDVNADGYDDVIVGVPLFDNGQTDEGRIFVYHGFAAGLSATAARTLESNQASANFGRWVASGGSVNGDAWDDVLVGAPLYDNGQTDEGRAYLYLGSASGVAATSAWTAESNVAGAQFGIAVAGAGDVNGDGFADLLVGASALTNGQSTEGRASLYLGAAGGPAATPSLTVESDLANARLGSAVAGAGDVDGNLLDDIIIGARGYGSGQGLEGRALVYTMIGDGRTECEGDCDDGRAAVYPGAPQICDGLNNDCTHAAWPATAGTNDENSDSDAFSLCQGDCDDGAAVVYPGAPQVCGDLLNNDCGDPAWPALSGTNEADDDGDAFSECQQDCDDADAGSWNPPAEARDLTLITDSGTEATILTWSEPLQPGSLAVAYDVLRSPMAADFGAVAECLEWNDGLDQVAADPVVVPDGSVLSYLVRARNGCSMHGSLGNASDGTPRSGRNCP